VIIYVTAITRPRPIESNTPVSRALTSRTRRAVAALCLWVSDRSPTVCTDCRECAQRLTYMRLPRGPRHAPNRLRCISRRKT